MGEKSKLKGRCLRKRVCNLGGESVKFLDGPRRGESDGEKITDTAFYRSTGMAVMIDCFMFHYTILYYIKLLYISYLY